MASPESLPLNKTYDGGTWEVHQDGFLAYAAATDDLNAAYQGEEGVAPPMFHVRGMIELMVQMAEDPELDIEVLRLVHGEHAMAFHRPLRNGEVVHLDGQLVAVDDKASGRVFAFALRGRVADEVVLAGRTTYFVRNPPSTQQSRAPKDRAAAPEPPPPNWMCTQQVTDDQAVRYALASGDHNPIHTDPDVAQSAGLPGPILHGLCTLALTARDLVNRYCDADPGDLLSLSVRWARPVFPGSTLRLEVWEQGGGFLEFRVLGPDDKPVLVHGRAQVRER